MRLSERCNYFYSIFQDLQKTNSTLEKRYIVSTIPEWLEDDFNAILECLAGKYIFGYTMWPSDYMVPDTRISEDCTVRSILEFLSTPRKSGDLSYDNIARYVHAVSHWDWFFIPIVNRTLKLGIGKSLLPKDGLAPMLAKKYEGKIKHDDAGYIITEKLDGNRCIASYEDDHWVFRSRNGKLMHVDFDMGDLPREYVYDGEVLSEAQTQSSMKLHAYIEHNLGTPAMIYDDQFSQTSGLINRHTLNKDLVYNIFDIMLDGATYLDRRIELRDIAENYNIGKDVRILPILSHTWHINLESEANELLHAVTSVGGEGIMINLCSATYSHKRTDQLLKLKKVQTIDMKVYDFEEGTGKYEGQIGALKAVCVTDDGKVIRCKIGSGLSDEQRMEWALDFSKICGKIVEVAYFSTSQTSTQKGSNEYSLRFPRLKSVRTDKNTTSEH